MQEELFQPDPIETFAVPPEDESFLAGAGRRMYRDMWILGFAGTGIFWAVYGWRWAGGFFVGALLSVFNFHSLHRVVAALAQMFSPDNGDSGHRPYIPGPVGSAFRIMFRYTLIALTAYAIFVSSFVNLTAFFIGIFLFVGAVLVEAAYELYSSFRSA